MTARFRDAAERLSAMATYWFGWSADQFWRATPKELEDLVKVANRSNHDAGTPLSQTQFEKLKDQFPDG